MSSDVSGESSLPLSLSETEKSQHQFNSTDSVKSPTLEAWLSGHPLANGNTTTKSWSHRLPNGLRYASSYFKSLPVFCYALAFRVRFWVAALTLLFLYTEVGNFWAAHWWNKWGMLLVAVSTWLCLKLGKRYSYLLTPVFLCPLLSAIWIFATDRSSYIDHYPMLDFLSLRGHVSFSFASVFIGAFFLTEFKREWMPSLKLILNIIFYASLIRTLYPHRLYADPHGAFSANASMNGVLLAVLLPLALMHIKKPLYQVLLWALTLWAVVLTKSSVPFGAFGIVTLVLFGNFIKDYFLMLGALPFLGLAGYFLVPDFLNSNGRMFNWNFIMNYWEFNVDHWLGSGLGTVISIIPTVQRMQHATGQQFEAWMWLHNDWMQLLFELGIIGMVLGLVTLGYLTIKAKSNTYLLASLLGFAGSALFDYPLRLPIHAFSFFALMWLILNQDLHEDPDRLHSDPALHC